MNRNAEDHRPANYIIRRRAELSAIKDIAMMRRTNQLHGWHDAQMSYSQKAARQGQN